MTQKLYIAYGSNLCKSVMRRRCPGARPLGKFTLTKAKLVFRGVADVEFDPYSTVPCALWLINRQDEAELDRYEGIAGGSYYKSEEILLKVDGKARPALIYLMTSQGTYPPTAHYIDVIRRGYRDFGLDESYLDAAIRQAYQNKDPQEPELLRRARQRKDPGQRQLAELPEHVALQRLDIIARGQGGDGPDCKSGETPVRASKKTKKKPAPKPATLAPAPKLALKQLVPSAPRLTARNAVVYGD